MLSQLPVNVLIESHLALLTNSQENQREREREHSSEIDKMEFSEPEGHLESLKVAALVLV